MAGRHVPGHSQRGLPGWQHRHRLPGRQVRLQPSAKLNVTKRLPSPHFRCPSGRQVRPENELPDVQPAERDRGDPGGRGSELRVLTGFPNALRVRREGRLGGRIRAE